MPKLWASLYSCTPFKTQTKPEHNARDSHVPLSLLVTLCYVINVYNGGGFTLGSKTSVQHGDFWA